MNPIQRDTKSKDKIFHYTYPGRDIAIPPVKIIDKETNHIRYSIAVGNLVIQYRMKSSFTACHRLGLSLCAFSQDRYSTFLFSNLSGTEFLLHMPFILFKQSNSQSFFASDAVIYPENEILI
jgi:hypothetical protein